MKMPNQRILANLQIYTPQGIQQKSALVIQGNSIHSIVSNEELHQFKGADRIDFSEIFHLVPGFIDLHVHGANGSDVMDGTVEALENMSLALAKEGTTGFLATTMTSSFEKLEKAVTSVRDSMVLQGAILGIHLEGPFLSSKKVGAQASDALLAPNVDFIEWLQARSNQAIKVVTVAPELPNAIEFIRYLKKQNIIASIGHTNATFAETIEAIKAGATHATHLFNAMRGIHQREPGAVTAALLSEDIVAELIVDGIHLHPAIVKLALKLKGKDKIFLVTDSMRAKCLCEGEYDLGGQSVSVKNNVATLSDGTLAGSVLKMNSALQNMLNYTDCSLVDVIKMTSENPAKALGMFDRKGSIEVGKDADLVVLDEKLNVVMTICGGEVVYRS